MITGRLTSALASKQVFQSSNLSALSSSLLSFVPCIPTHIDSVLFLGLSNLSADGTLKLEFGECPTGAVRMTDRPSKQELVEYWNLSTMPTENVLFYQSYLDPKVGSDGKPLCSAIVALLTNDPSAFSDMHRLPTDEIWHFYLGDPIELLLLYPDGRDELVILGQNILNGEKVQTLVPANVWMGARLKPGGEYGVYGNTMAPGFVLGDFEGARADDLIERWPHRADLINAMIRPNAPLSYA